LLFRYSAEATPHYAFTGAGMPLDTVALLASEHGIRRLQASDTVKDEIDT
jgi:hypothetical protein